MPAFSTEHFRLRRTPLDAVQAPQFRNFVTAFLFCIPFFKVLQFSLSFTPTVHLLESFIHLIVLY